MPEVLEFRRATVDSSPGAPATDVRIAVAVIVTGVVAYVGSAALEPPAHHPSSAWVSVALVGETVLLGLAFAGSLAVLHGRAQLGYGALAGAAWVLLALVVGCPVSGHHTFGAWWAGQMALALAFAAVATVACAITRRGSRPAHRAAD
jgi:hypothetical protein